MVASKAPEGVTQTVEWVSLTSITTDQAVNTRPVDFAWVQRHVPDFDPAKLGIPIVSARSDGNYVWLDGQNRGELMRQAGWGDQKIECRVFRGLNVAQEAELFLGHNDNRQVKPVYKFLARVTSGEPVAVAINEIVTAHGWRIHDQSISGAITAVRSLEKIYTGSRHTNADLPAGLALAWTLGTVTSAWGHKAEAANGEVLFGIGSVFGRYGEDVDRPVLVKKLTGYQAGPLGLLGDARGLRQFQGGTVANSVSEVVVRLYNRNRRVRTLPDWRS